MSDLVVITYSSVERANEVRSMLMRLNKEYLLDLQDAVVAVKGPDGKVRLDQMYNLSATGAVSGGFWGLLIGILFLNPLLGLAIGAGAGAASGALTDIGVSDAFIRELAESFQPGCSVLLVLFDKVTHDKVLAELAGTGGKVIKTSLTNADETILQNALNGCLAAAGCQADTVNAPHDSVPAASAEPNESVTVRPDILAGAPAH